MDELKKHSLLITLMVILGAVKFILVPVYDWQDAQLAEIKLLAKKKSKIENILNQEETFQQNHEKLAAEVKKGNAVFFPYQKEADFKLTQQKLLESLFKKHQVAASNIGWQVITPIPEININSFQIRVQFTGETLNVIQFMGALERYPQRIEITEFYLDLANQSGKKLGKTNGWFMLKFYANATEQDNSTEAKA
ncbi:hypothetical protein [Thalassotalea piscium]|uniref:Type 4a pilus biogenesis protein PilO n=1 Tax=Thalassotalea piscium TaxID=1230533 RepID=A0A7X0TT15_9GAMM|nr:hypothetical protein [Thalassotalea piscium]MBB6542762.1 hypothetical protein [Thalassotalea piscium]